MRGLWLALAPGFGHDPAMIKRLTQVSAVLAALSTAAMATAAVAEDAPVVVELFTSQGCYSCPPADELLGELAARKDVLPLAFHVTYWDRLGWPDTLGLEAGTARQEAYARWMGTGRVYTPQMVVQGRIDVVGSQRSRVMRALDIAADASGVRLDIDGAQVEIPAGSEAATVWLATYDDVHEVPIERGENAGKTLTYHNAVRELTELGRYDGRAMSAELPLARLAAEGRDGAAVLLQRKSDGAIIGAAKVALPGG
ncbi:MAG: DUF1223 domain-containing protein [Alphaproteobacteria bacterium]